jgi:hypothetical protein
VLASVNAFSPYRRAVMRHASEIINNLRQDV